MLCLTHAESARIDIVHRDSGEKITLIIDEIKLPSRKVRVAYCDDLHNFGIVRHDAKNKRCDGCDMPNGDCCCGDVFAQCPAGSSQ